MDSQFNFIQLVMPQKSTHIKMEPFGSSFSFISFPTTPSSPSVSSPAAVSRNGSISSLVGQKRPRPYPPVNCEPSLRQEELATMSNSSVYSSWSTTTRPQHPAERKSSDGDKPASYAAHPQFNGPYLANSSSSLMGAMGEPTIHSRRSSSSSGGRMYPNAQPPNVMWNNAQQNMAIPSMNTSTYPTHGNLSYTDMNSSSMNMDDYATNHNAPVSPRSPSYQGHSSTQPLGNNGMYMSPSPPSDGHGDDEVHRLRSKVRELELECARNRTTIESLRQTTAAEFPTPSPSPSFQASWRARTEARRKIFCSVNRAGNALCSWHDSRRERRIYAPRQAPPGFLNCGCSYEEALFEESLSRNNVGSYLPGEAVRMDPALRNPLLKLLEKRYGYKDGDFERNPITERWADGESPAIWEQKALSGHSVRRRTEAH